MPKPANPQRFGDLEPSTYPGQRLGLPETGSRSVARLGRRVIALFIDWGIAVLIAHWITSGTDASLLTLGIYMLMQIVFIPTIGGSIGHRILRMRVVPLIGGWVGLWRPAVRTVLIAMVLPLLVWDSDQRAFHDKIAGTVLIRD